MDNPLAKFDEQIDAMGKIGNIPAKWLSNGFYTLTFPDGSHKTFRIRTEKNGKPKGRRTVAMLIGPDNSSDYEPFAFLDEEGPKIWNRFKNTRQGTYPQLVWDISKGEQIEGYELLVSTRCLICNRPLTKPSSIDKNIGENCYKRMMK